MGVAIGQSQTSDVSNPIFDIFIAVNGFLKDVVSLEFQIFDETGASPSQVFPPSGRQAVDLTDERLSLGHYVAVYTADVAEPIGKHRIHWFYKVEATDPEREVTEVFEVLGFEVFGFGYAFVFEMRDEGITATVADDERMFETIFVQSQLIDKITGRNFDAEAKTLSINGRGGRILQLEEPIVALESVEILPQPFVSGGTLVDQDNMRVFNRHLSQNLRRPDDRANPRIEFIHGRDLLGVRGQPFDIAAGLTTFVWPTGPQTIEIKGAFGYTEPNGSPAGKTPRLVNRIARLLTNRFFRQISDTQQQAVTRDARIKREKTRDQEVEFDKPVGALVGGVFTGDPEIDNLLVMFMRPIGLGAA